MMRALEWLRGITDQECDRLRSRGIQHTNQLLHATSLEIDRRRLARRSGIQEARLLEFARQCSLLEVSGTERFQPLLRRLGVTSARLLAQQEALELHRRITAAVGLAGTPGLSDVEYWISQARYIDIVEEPEVVSAGG